MSFLSKIIVFLFIFSYLRAQTPFVGQADCNSANCPLPDCYCASYNIPGGLDLANTPQFITFTLDDSMFQSDFDRMNKFDWIFNNPAIKDSLGCTIKTTWYALQSWTDFNVLNYVSKIGDVGLHSYSHTTGINSNYDIFSTEWATLRHDFPKLGQVPNCKVDGSRAPYLQINDDYLQTLVDLDVTYDTSMTYINHETKSAPWPFTLDYGVFDESICSYFGRCPTRAFPGLWEFTMIETDYSLKGNLMDPIFTDYDTYLESLKQNFRDTYESNKVPRGFYWHWRYFSTDNNFGLINPSDPIDDVKVQLFVEFYTWLVTTYDDIIFATPRQVIEWMKNPVDTATTKTLPMFTTCPSLTEDPSTSCHNGDFLTCYYPNIQPFKVCGTECPNINPDLGSAWVFSSGEEPHQETCTTFDGEVQEDSTSDGTDNETTDGNATGNESGTDNETDLEETAANAGQIKWRGVIEANWFAGSGSDTVFGIYGWMCAELFLSNPGPLTATHFVISAESCLTSSFFNDAWGWLTEPSSLQNELRLRTTGPRSFAPGTTTEIYAGFCLAVNSQPALGEIFVWPDHFRIGVDLYGEEPNCTVDECMVECGDKVCDNSIGETADNCGIDCVPFNCPV